MFLPTCLTLKEQRVCSIVKLLRRNCSVKPGIEDAFISVNGTTFTRDSFTNVTPRILSHLNRNLCSQQQHPLGLIKQNIINYMYTSYRNVRGNPVFSVHQHLNPVVSLYQNFDSLLIPGDHVSRKQGDSYYVNSQHMLRSHTSAHQEDLIRMGLDNFLVVGDVYRRDEIDKTHYPVFHQMEAVRLLDQHSLSQLVKTKENLQLFENSERSKEKQAVHTMDAAKLTELELKNCLVGLARHLFGADIKLRWVDCYFPFTHPSWELEVFYNGEWLEVLGCGVMEQEILARAGVQNKVGWAFGLGLERLAMVLYSIPDIRLFWTRDTGFLSQFKDAKPDSRITYKEVSKFPQCVNDISFWLPSGRLAATYSPNDFYDLVREVGGDTVEQVRLIDEFTHPKKQLTSHCYRIVYRDMAKTLTQEEVNVIHQKIVNEAADKLKVTVR